MKLPSKPLPQALVIVVVLCLCALAGAIVDAL